MFTVYVDDSGTHRESTVAAGAQCVSSVKRWKKFERQWHDIERRERFPHFHMAEFAACRRGHWCRQCRDGKTTLEDHPWRDWSLSKRKRVLTALANTVVKHTDFGFGMAIIKQDYEDFFTGELRRQAGEYAYSYCVKLLGGSLKNWREHTHVRGELKYVFDLTPDVNQKSEIVEMFILASRMPDQADDYGMALDGYSFENKRAVVQLLASDMLAWATWQWRVCLTGKRKTSPELRILKSVFLRKPRRCILGTVTRKQVQESVEEWARRTQNP